MAKLRFTKPGESKDKKRFKKNLKIKKYSNRLLIAILVFYVAHKEQLVDYIAKLLR
jgi:hypothetical protein